MRDAAVTRRPTITAGAGGCGEIYQVRKDKMKSGESTRCFQCAKKIKRQTHGETVQEG